MADFPALGSESQEESRKRGSGPQPAVRRAKSAKRTSSVDGQQILAEKQGSLTYAKEGLKVIDFGGNGDCGYRVLACMAA
eukprot:8448075-Alexandrium_andersonii.AAC.1